MKVSAKNIVDYYFHQRSSACLASFAANSENARCAAEISGHSAGSRIVAEENTVRQFVTPFLKIRIELNDVQALILSRKVKINSKKSKKLFLTLLPLSRLATLRRLGLELISTECTFIDACHACSRRYIKTNALLPTKSSVLRN